MGRRAAERGLIIDLAVFEGSYLVLATDIRNATGDRLRDAMLGAIGEHLARRWFLPQVRSWTEDPRRFLDHAHYTCGEHMKPFYLAESPLAFRRRFIFTEAEPLRRATMPTDGRWWAYETLRSGLTPGPGDIVAS